ncbi:hypothetical protein [Nocardioides pinisoli]|uniref:Uncharacterized protein n=1 Tax=Nocardioides pinisoli TaxID=2950279 RepID=A0ABT1KSX7_9ACTN|nr:hypothetical protein [Nocardioides pinisoli]MCP3420832.1 hypothetical protein [Nocardioides pinisoli]
MRSQEKSSLTPLEMCLLVHTHRDDPETQATPEDGPPEQAARQRDDLRDAIARHAAGPQAGGKRRWWSARR